MSSVTVLNQSAEPVGNVDLDDQVFGVEVREHLLHEMVRMQLANRRSANPSTKTRSQISGGGAKPYRQKGTGRARQGSTRSPHWRGGGVVFGPDGRNYSLSMNKKAKREALRSALSLRNQEGKLIVLDDFSLETYKTNGFLAVMKALKVDSALFILGEKDEVVMVSGRNIPSVKVLPTDGLNVYDILGHHHLVVTVPAVNRIHERLKA